MALAPANLLIGADGFQSNVRNQILPEVKPVYAGYIARRALPTEDIPATTWEAIQQHYVFRVPEGEPLVSCQSATAT